MEPVMRQKLHEVCEDYQRLNDLMATNEVASDPDLFQKHAKKAKDISALVKRFKEFLHDEEEHAGATEMFHNESDPEMREMADIERRELAARIKEHEIELKLLLLPKDPNDSKNTIVELRAGTGGDEAALFCADLFKAYVRYAEIKGWKVEILNTNEIGLGGYKEITFKITG